MNWLLKNIKLIAALILLVVFAILLFFFITYPYPISSSPDYDSATYEEFVLRLSSAEQEYLVPDITYIQASESDVLYRIFLKNRNSCESQGYVCSIRDVNDYNELILYISATPDDQSGIDSELVQHISDSQIEILFQQQTECMIVTFEFSGLNYLIKSYPKATYDALTIAKAMIDSITA